jgi:hypothetical protein
MQFFTFAMTWCGLLPQVDSDVTLYAMTMAIAQAIMQVILWGFKRLFAL